MSGLGAEHVRARSLEPIYGRGLDMFGQSLWNPTRGPDMSGLTGVFGGRVDF
jgi:hypothetical protein